MTDEDSAWERTTIERAFARATALAKENASLRAEQDHYLRQWASIVEASGIDPFSLRDDGDSSEMTAALCRMLRSARGTPPVVTLHVVPAEEIPAACGECNSIGQEPQGSFGAYRRCEAVPGNEPPMLTMQLVAPPSWCPKRQKP